MTSRLALLGGVTLMCVSSLRAERLPIRSYTVGDGLAQDTVNRIVRDRSGFLWFCTAEGVSRFDGHEFSTYGTDQGLPHHFVTDVLETKSTDLWVATSGGLARLQRADTAVKPSTFTSIDAPLGRSRINALHEGRDGAIWIGAEDGLYRMDCSSATCSAKRVDVGVEHDTGGVREIFDVLEDRRGYLWAATPSGLWRRAPDGHVRRFTKADGLPDDFLHCLMQDRRGDLWVGSRHAGVFRLSETSASIPTVIERDLLRTADGEPITWVSDIFEAGDEDLWVATHRGIVHLQQDVAGTRLVRAFGTPQGLTDHNILALAEDESGNLWVGTHTTGAMKVIRGGFVRYGEADGILGANAIFGDGEGGVCFRANLIGDVARPIVEGASLRPGRSADDYWIRFGRFDGERFHWLLPAGVTHGQLGWVGERITLRAKSGEWWIGTGIGVLRFPPVKFEDLAAAQPLAFYRSDQVFALFEDGHGNIWISTTSAQKNRLLQWKRDRSPTRDLAVVAGLAALADAPARSFGQDASGNIWVGLRSGVARYANGRFTFYGERDGLPAGAVNDIHNDRSGRLWMTFSAGGVVRIDAPDDFPRNLHRYTTTNGLSSNFALVLAEDRAGSMYVATGRGLDEIEAGTGRIRHFTSADGLPPGRILTLHCDERGIVWIGATRGISRFDPAQRAMARAPIVLVTQIDVGGVSRLNSVGQQQATISPLDAEQNHVQLTFTAPDFTAGDRLTYQYKLEGASASHWSAPFGERRVSFANLAPGNYRVLVRALSSTGMASRTPATITFTILPRFWQRWWFTPFVLLIALLVVYAVHRHRVRSIIALANLRAHIASDLHDDIGANLTRIAMLSEVARRQAGGNGDGPLYSIAEIARESVSAMSDIVWAVNPDRDSVTDLVRRMRRLGEEVVLSDSRSFSFEVSGTDDHLKLGPALRRSIFLVYKEAINNAVRHSRCSRLSVVLTVEGRLLELRVRDDGVGFVASTLNNGHGLDSMKRRAGKVGGALDINSRPGSGTTVCLQLNVS